MLANRRAARAEDLAEHGGRPVSFRTALHKSKKVYNRKRLKRTGIHSDDLSFLNITSGRNKDGHMMSELEKLDDLIAGYIGKDFEWESPEKRNEPIITAEPPVRIGPRQRKKTFDYFEERPAPSLI